MKWFAETTDYRDSVPNGIYLLDDSKSKMYAFRARGTEAIKVFKNPIRMDMRGRKFVESNGIVWPNLYDPDGRSREYFGMGVPVTWFIAADGSVAGKKIGVFKNQIELIAMANKYLRLQL